MNRAVIGGALLALATIVIISIKSGPQAPTSKLELQTRAPAIGSIPTSHDLVQLEAPELPTQVRTNPGGGAVAVEGVDELPHSSDTVDPSGLTKEQELRFLLTAHERFTKFADSRPGVGLAGDELGFARRCVATILRSRGRADYGDPEALKESGGFSLRRSAPDEQVFAADRARFRFSKGEFPAYDQAFSRWEAAFVEGKQIGPITPDLRQGYDALYQEALDVLGVADLNVSLEDK